MKVNAAKLADITTINPSLANGSALNDELVAFVPMASVSAEPPVVTVLETLPLSSVKNGFSYFQNGDILVAKITPCFENGKIAQARIDQQHGFGSTEFHVVRPNESYVDARYLLHFLRQDYIRLDGERKMTGSAGQRRVPRHFIESLEIPLPPIAQQKRIAAILDKAEELRGLRRKALGELDAIVQSIFLEMFGDPITNPKSLLTTTLLQVSRRITDGTHQPPKWASHGIPFLFVSNIVDGQINFETQKFISEETHTSLMKRCPVEIGDVLYTTVGSYGNAALVSTNRKFSFQRHIAHIKPKISKINPLFLASMLQSPGVRQQVDKTARGAAQKTVNLADLKELTIFLPQLALQQEFARRVEAIEQLKATHRESLAHLDALFASLQHRAFRGEL